MVHWRLERWLNWLFVLRVLGDLAFGWCTTLNVNEWEPSNELDSATLYASCVFREVGLSTTWTSSLDLSTDCATRPKLTTKSSQSNWMPRINSWKTCLLASLNKSSCRKCRLDKSYELHASNKYLLFHALIYLLIIPANVDIAPRLRVKVLFSRMSIHSSAFMVPTYLHAICCYLDLHCLVCRPTHCSLGRWEVQPDKHKYSIVPGPYCQVSSLFRGFGRLLVFRSKRTTIRTRLLLFEVECDSIGRKHELQQAEHCSSREIECGSDD